MKTRHRIALSMLIGATGLIGSALAADMTGAEIKAFVSGKTVYLETTAVSATGTPGQGAVYLAEDGTGLYKTPTGAIGTENGTLKATRFAPIGRRGRTIRARAGTRPETPSQLSTPSAVRPGPKL